MQSAWREVESVSTAPSRIGTRINQQHPNQSWFTNHRMTNYKPAKAAFWVAP